MEVIEGQFIGAGEITTLELLKLTFGGNTKDNYKIQVPLRQIIKESHIQDMSERQMKESIDIVVVKPPICVRVQDKRHITKKFGYIDEAQRQELEEAGYKVVDVWFNECPEIFSDRVNDKSYNELQVCLKREGFYH